MQAASEPIAARLVVVGDEPTARERGEDPRDGARARTRFAARSRSCRARGPRGRRRARPSRARRRRRCAGLVFRFGPCYVSSQILAHYCRGGNSTWPRFRSPLPTSSSAPESTASRPRTTSPRSSTTRGLGSGARRRRPREVAPGRRRLRDRLRRRPQQLLPAGDERAHAGLRRGVGVGSGRLRATTRSATSRSARRCRSRTSRRRSSARSGSATARPSSPARPRSTAT